MSCLFGQQIVKCVIRIVKYITKQFVVIVFNDRAAAGLSQFGIIPHVLRVG